MNTHLLTMLDRGVCRILFPRVGIIWSVVVYVISKARWNREGHPEMAAYHSCTCGRTQGRVGTLGDESGDQQPFQCCGVVPLDLSGLLRDPFGSIGSEAPLPLAAESDCDLWGTGSWH